MIYLLIFFVLLVILSCIIDYTIIRGARQKSNKPKPGDVVTIHIKPYIGEKHTGVVKDVLTKKKYHSHGHKVRLESGIIGRVCDQ